MLSFVLFVLPLILGSDKDPIKTFQDLKGWEVMKDLDP